MWPLRQLWPVRTTDTDFSARRRKRPAPRQQLQERLSFGRLRTTTRTPANTTGQGRQSGKVASTEALPNGQTNLHLAIESSQLHQIPANVLVKITMPTAVQLIVPANPAPQRLHAGQVLNAQPTAASGAELRTPLMLNRTISNSGST